MEKRTDIWQVSGSTVFKLKATGKFIRGEEELTNDVSFVVHSYEDDPQFNSELNQGIADALNLYKKQQTIAIAAEQLLKATRKFIACEGDEEQKESSKCDLLYAETALERMLEAYKKASCNTESELLPVLVPMPPIPPNSNPFHHDLYNMGCEISGGWMAMYNQFFGNSQFGDKLPHPEPQYIILVNCRTGQRFRLEWPKTIQFMDSKEEG